jgi:glyoxylase-like metal-dependent hydrolase (beta-lactamase superfamily II)
MLIKPLFVLLSILACMAVQIVSAADYYPGIKKIKTIRYEASGQRFEPMQNQTPYGPSRHVSNYKTTVTWDQAKDNASQQWQLATIYPYPSTFSFQLVFEDDHGYRIGQEGVAPGNEGAMEPARVGAESKFLWLSNPILLESYAEFPSVTNIHVKGSVYNRKVFSAHGSTWEVLSDNVTGYPIEIVTKENDPLEGQVDNKIIFADWRVVSGVPFPFRLEQTINDKLVLREIRHNIEINPRGAEEVLTLPSGKEYRIDANLQDWGWSMSHFFQRRMAMGRPVDTDQSAVVQFQEVGDGLYHVTGSGHLNLIIEGPDGLAIVDAVWYPKRSQNILSEIRKKWPDKPLKYVILTHHHIDHAGGIHSFAEVGATVVTSKKNNPYFQRIINKNISRDSTFIPVDSTGELEGIGRTIELYDIPSSHADGYLAVYIPDANLLFNADLFSPGRATQNPLWLSEFLHGVEYHGINVKGHIGGHGVGIDPHEKLINLVESN